MKRAAILIALMALVSCGTARKVQKEDSAEFTVRIGTYNVWKSTNGKGDYAWEIRKERLAQSIADIGFDVFGIQEVDYRIQEELPLLLKNHGAHEYEWYMFSPYSPDGVGDKAQAILYRKDRFRLVNGNYFWISETPETMSQSWDELKYFRGGCCVTLEDIRTGRKFFVMNSHFPMGKQARLQSADVIISQEKKFNTENLPAFLVGDLNITPDNPSSVKLRAYWTDSFLALPEEAKEGSSGTMNSANVNKDMSKAKRIDYVYFKGGVTPQKYHCANEKYDGLWPSDHCAVYTDMKFN